MPCLTCDILPLLPSARIAFDIALPPITCNSIIQLLVCICTHVRGKIYSPQSCKIVLRIKNFWNVFESIENLINCLFLRTIVQIFDRETFNCTDVPRRSGITGVIVRSKRVWKNSKNNSVRGEFIFENIKKLLQLFFRNTTHILAEHESKLQTVCYTFAKLLYLMLINITPKYLFESMILRHAFVLGYPRSHTAVMNLRLARCITRIVILSIPL